jgi:hypothetical protein
MGQLNMMREMALIRTLLYEVVTEMRNRPEAGSVSAFGGRSFQLDLLLTEIKGLREDVNKSVDYLARRR